MTRAASYNVTPKFRSFYTDGIEPKLINGLLFHKELFTGVTYTIKTIIITSMEQVDSG